MTIAEIFETMSYGPAPESRAAADEWLAAHGGRFGLFIGGQFVEPAGGESTTCKNPAAGEVLAQIAIARQADVDAAVKAARQAQPGWAAMPGVQRARYLYAIARTVQKQHKRIFLSGLDRLGFH